MLAFANEFGLKIGGSRHDFTRGYVGWETAPGTWALYFSPAGQCAPCHAPHKAAQAKQLWARTVTSGQSWVVYDAQGAERLGANGQLEYAGKTLGADDGRFLSAEDFEKSGSGRCLSCHDGVTAIGGGVKMNPDPPNSDTRRNFGTDMHAKHPVGIRIPWGREGFFSALSTDYPGAPAYFKAQVAMDYKGSVGCTSCHSMHSGETYEAPNYNILRMGETCLACHDR
ncbi:MAG: hypothetical protein HYZ75_10810 [Elusimicrobia bacterium]|nr:hypothetical protein [Elusimicrobiota bacterium]